jgi:hypothetical protein
MSKKAGRKFNQTKNTNMKTLRINNGRVEEFENGSLRSIMDQQKSPRGALALIFCSYASTQRQVIAARHNTIAYGDYFYS